MTQEHESNTLHNIRLEYKEKVKKIRQAIKISEENWIDWYLIFNYIFITFEIFSLITSYKKVQVRLPQKVPNSHGFPNLIISKA